MEENACVLLSERRKAITAQLFPCSEMDSVRGGQNTLCACI